MADEGCQNGSYAACWTLGEFLASSGRDHDSAAAHRYFERGFALATPSCGNDELRACELLADAYETGRGVQRDHQKATDYLLRLKELVAKGD